MDITCTLSKYNFFISNKEYILRVESAHPTIKILLITKVYKTKDNEIICQLVAFANFNALL